MINVLKPKKPTVTEIACLKLTEHPEYKHDTYIET